MLVHSNMAYNQSRAGVLPFGIEVSPEKALPPTVGCVCVGGNKYGRARKPERGQHETLFCGCDKTPQPWQLRKGRVCLGFGF